LTGSGGSGAAGGALPAITLWLAGDSTVQDNGPGKLPEGWGTEIGQFFNSKVTVVDRAIGGRNVQTFMYSDTSNTTETSTWASMKASMKPGDYFMVQFGANDSSPGSVRYLTPATYKTLLGVMLDAVKTKHVTPILVTPSCLQIWIDGKIDNSRLAPYVAAMIDLGPKKDTLVDDLNARSVEYVNSLGRTAANTLIYYNNDKAHFTKAGATQMAQFVVNELKRIGSPLAAYVK
jgi:lysophospholipase L1-like esterase